MSYLVLARKWRPQRFDDVVGQQHVLRALTHALENDKLHHAYLFAGTRGVGKTTLARILAKALNCEQGVSATPCGECSACTEIDGGRFVDLIEVDAASRTKVDDTRELLDNVQYRPTRGRTKVYLIDEVHMLSTHSFNALLKTLEEPPDYVTFLLATTDPQKLPVTVLSRCLQFNLKRLTPALIADRLGHIATEEGIEADDGALALISRAADGSLRDALSIMDQAIAYGGGTLAEQPVAAMLGALDRNTVVRIAEQLAAGDAAALLGLVEEADAQFPDYGLLLDELAGLFVRVAVYHATGASDADEVEGEEIERLASLLPEADVQLYYQIALVGKRDLAMAPDPRAGIEMTLLRMLAFRPGGMSPGPSTRGAGESGADAQEAGSDGRARGAGGSDGVAPSATPGDAANTNSSMNSNSDAEVAVREPAPASGEDSGIAAGLEDWHRLLGQLSLNGVSRLLAANCAFTGRDGAVVRLALDRRSESLLTPARVEELERALAKHLDETVTVRIEIDGQAATETPTQRAAREAAEKESEVRGALERDPAVEVLRSTFDAEFVDGDGTAPGRDGA